MIVKSCFKCFRHFSSSCGDDLIHWFDYIHQFHNVQHFHSFQGVPSCYNSIQLIGSNHRLYMIEVVERLALVLLLLSSWSDNTLLRNQRGAHMVQELRPEVQVLWMTKGPPHLHHHHLWLQGPTKHITLVIVSLFIFLMSISMHCHTHNHCHFEWCYSNIKALQTTQGR